MKVVEIHFQVLPHAAGTAFRVACKNDWDLELHLKKLLSGQVLQADLLENGQCGALECHNFVMKPVLEEVDFYSTAWR